MGEIEAGFTEAMQTRHDTGLASDFFAAGDVRVEVIGAASEQLEFRETYRALTEQIVSVTGLPPFMLGLSWASTERMSSQQSEVIIAEIHDLRRELEPMVEQLVDLWLALTPVSYTHLDVYKRQPPGHRSYQGFAGNRLTDSGHRQTGRCWV